MTSSEGSQGDLGSKSATQSLFQYCSSFDDFKELGEWEKDGEKEEEGEEGEEGEEQTNSDDEKEKEREEEKETEEKERKEEKETEEKERNKSPRGPIIAPRSLRISPRSPTIINSRSPKRISPTSPSTSPRSSEEDKKEEGEGEGEGGARSRSPFVRQHRKRDLGPNFVGPLLISPKKTQFDSPPRVKEGGGEREREREGRERKGPRGGLHQLRYKSPDLSSYRQAILSRNPSPSPSPPVTKLHSSPKEFLSPKITRFSDDS